MVGLLGEEFVAHNVKGVIAEAIFRLALVNACPDLLKPPCLQSFIDCFKSPQHNLSYYAKLVKTLIVFCGLRDRHKNDAVKNKLVSKSISTGYVCILL